MNQESALTVLTVSTAMQMSMDLAASILGNEVADTLNGKTITDKTLAALIGSNVVVAVTTK